MGSTPVIYCSRCGQPSAPGAPFCAQCGGDLRGGQAAVPMAPGAAPAYYASAERYGGFWVRFIAIVIDWVVVNVVVWPVLLLFGLAVGLAGSVTRLPNPGIAMVRAFTFLGFTTIVNWLYEALMWSSSKQATLGKMALGLRVTDLYGQRISFARATGRHFAKIISGMTLLIGYIMAAFTDRHQALHDMIGGTLVEKAGPLR
jgi:uncharacterized RDD family membrane protein YckC